MDAGRAYPAGPGLELELQQLRIAQDAVEGRAQLRGTCLARKSDLSLLASSAGAPVLERLKDSCTVSAMRLNERASSPISSAERASSRWDRSPAWKRPDRRSCR